jgi:hypothetical protein
MSESEPSWAAQCRQCANLKVGRGGRHWRCRAERGPSSRVGWAATARQPGAICGPEGKAFKPLQELCAGCGEPVPCRADCPCGTLKPTGISASWPNQKVSDE